MGKGRRRFLNYLLYTKMAKKDYSVEDKLALLEEAKQFFKDYWYLDERLKAKWKPVLLMSELIKWEKDTESRKERLDVVIGFVESLQLEDEYADWVRSWLWLLFLCLLYIVLLPLFLTLLFLLWFLLPL